MSSLPEGPTRKHIPTSTVGRGRSVKAIQRAEHRVWSTELVSVCQGDSLQYYGGWERPKVIISDGGYGVLGFEGDTSDHLALPSWYEPHVEAWSKAATPSTTLWFWNSEIGWAAVHPVLEQHGWRYVNANVWNKGKGHIAGNVNTKKIRRFPVVTELCVQYVFEARVDGLTLKEWLLREWRRAGLRLRQANEACGVKDVAVRKYLSQGHLWYFPPPAMFQCLQEYANKHGHASGRPYYSLDGISPGTAEQWAVMRAPFKCPHGVTNVWERPALRGAERVRVPASGGKALHLNQKPLDLITRSISASSEQGDVVWEPFGGLFTACIAAHRLGRRAFGAELDPTYYYYGQRRVIGECSQRQLL